MSPVILHAEGRERNAPADRQAELADLQQLAARLAATVPPEFDEIVDRAETVENTARFLLHVLETGGLDAFLEQWIPGVFQEMCVHDAHLSQGGAA